jgi:hypothetical protein
VGDNILGVAAVFVAVIVFGAVVLTMRSRRKILGLLVGASAGLIAAQIFQVHIFTILVLLWAILSRRESKKLLPLQAISIIAAAAVLASTVFFGQLVNNQNLGLQLVAFAICAAIIVVTASADDTASMLYGLFATASLASAWGLLQVAGIAPNDAWHLDVSALGRPTGIYPEPDWLGMFAGIGLVLAWRLPVGRWLRIALIVVNAGAWVLAFARAGWIATVASCALAALILLLDRPKPAMPDRRPQTSSPAAREISLAPRTRWRADKPMVQKKRSGRMLGTLLSVTVGLIAVSVIPQLHDNLVTRLSRTLTVHDNDISAQARVAQNNGLQFLAETAPWYGWGLSSSGRVGVSGRLNYGVSENNVGSNWVASMWVDGAWLSLPIIAVLIIGCLVAAKAIQGQLLLLVLLNSFFTNATFQPVTWLLVGLCFAYSRRRQERNLELRRFDEGGPTGERPRLSYVSQV